MQLNPKDGSIASSLLSVTQINGIYDPPFTPHDDVSIERITVLGAQEPNPYLIPNMQQAYLALGYNPNLATVTNLYVRFKPTVDQLAALDSIMDAQGLELFDTPMDYDVTYEGDYYQDPSIPDSLPTWQYAVVPPNFVFPSGITHETLAQIHIPPDNYTAIETEAENIAGGGLNNSVQANRVIVPNVPQCATGYHWDYNLLQCVPNNCPPGYFWSGTACVPANCQSGYYFDGTSCVPYNNIPPAPAPDAQTPAGYIKVYDTQLSASHLFADGLPVKKVRVVARRWFKVDRMYTDNYGYFVGNKHYKNKVRILVKFKNDDAQIKNIRGAQFWQMLFAVKKEVGIFSSDKNNVQYLADQFPTYSAKGNIYWTAATVHNSVQEYRSYAPSEGIGLPPQGLKIFISKLSLIGNGGATPMLAKRFDPLNSSSFGQNFFDSDPNIVPRIFVVVQRRLDMIIGYRYSDIAHLLSDQLKETTYHELTHAGHYAAMGVTWYANFVNAEVAEIEHTFLFDKGYNPYGRGTDSNAPIIALGESWAEYIGQYFADKTYGQHSSTYISVFSGEQGENNYPLNGYSSHINDLENFVPNVSGAHFSWIPVGLYYDMNDPRNDATAVPRIVNIDDQVSGYTNQQFFNAFSSSITSMGSYKTNLLNQNGNNQSTQVTSLFSQYGF